MNIGDTFKIIYYGDPFVVMITAIKFDVFDIAVVNNKEPSGLVGISNCSEDDFYNKYIASKVDFDGPKTVCDDCHRFCQQTCKRKYFYR